MPRDKEEIWKLKGRIRELEEENEELKKKLDRARGVPAEVLVAQMTGGKRTEGYKHLHDVTTKKGNRIEVKLSGVSIVVQVTRIARGLAKRVCRQCSLVDCASPVQNPTRCTGWDFGSTGCSALRTSCGVGVSPSFRMATYLLRISSIS
jgi:hypothetical protein